MCLYEVIYSKEVVWNICLSSYCQTLHSIISQSVQLFSPLSPLPDRPTQTASVGADTVSAGRNRPSVDEMLTICCVYTHSLFQLYSFDSLWCINDFPPVSQVSGFGAALFTRERAALFHHGWNSPDSQLLFGACQIAVKYEEYIFVGLSEKLSLSAQFIAFERLQAGSNTTSVDFSALGLEV